MTRKRSRRQEATPTGSEAIASRIIAVALEQAEEAGWEGLRLARVASHVGIPLAELHRHFAGADRLADAWLDRAERAMVARAPALAALPARARIAGAVFAWLDVLAPHRRVARQVLLGKLYPGHPHLVAGAVVRLSRTVQLLREVAGLHAPPPRRQAEEVALTALFVATLARWSIDASLDQAKTRAWLDRRLALLALLRAPSRA
jgi:AcrR family transcriptional regulator